MSPAKVMQPAGLSLKRMLETSLTTSNTDRNVKPRFDLDLDILECPICTEPLSPPVFQCQNGHRLCAACHVKISICPSCSEPTGNTRCLLAEKTIDSLQVGCLYAPDGCGQMLKYSIREKLIKDLCGCRRCPCPALGCKHEGPKQTLLQHLVQVHKLKIFTLSLNTVTGLLEAISD